MLPLDSKDIQLLTALSRELSLTATGQRLGITGSAVSQRLGKIEDKIGFKLATRKGRVALTPAGKIVLEHCENITRSNSMLKNSLQQLQEPAIRIIADDILLIHDLPLAVQQLLIEKPTLKVTLDHGSFSEIIHSVIDGIADAGLIAGDPNICTDPDCFAEKTAAHNVKKLNAANKKGIPVLEGEEATRANNGIIYDRWCSENVDDEATLRYFDRVKDAPGDTNVIELLSSKAPAADFALKLDYGKVKMVYTRAKVQAALEKAGICFTEQEQESLDQAENENKVTDPVQNDAYLERLKKEDEKKQRAEKETAFRVALYKRLRQRSFAGFSLQSLREFVKAIVTDYRNDFSVPDDLLGDLYPFVGGADDTVGSSLNPQYSLILSISSCVGLRSRCGDSFGLRTSLVGLCDIHFHSVAAVLRTWDHRFRILLIVEPETPFVSSVPFMRRSRHRPIRSDDISTSSMSPNRLPSITNSTRALRRSASHRYPRLCFDTSSS
ncbi:LysR family transcriptional regulator [Undibacterium sp. TC9W]|uniref:LysR family transcriptional regulator n=1 Tax=Undibacterium sp. TC9W TaxID=3413053 RepID=UPI003BF32AA6